jgi:uncharacterized protein (DUF433 family)
MSTATEYPHLTIADDESVRIGSSRYKVLHLAAEHFHYGWTAEELLRQHPDLRPEEVYSALAYFYDHRTDLLSQLESTQDGSAVAPQIALTRDELLRRRSIPPTR